MRTDPFLARLRLMDASQPHTQREIAEFCAVSPQAVQQVEYSALKKCLRRARRLGLQDELRGLVER